MCWEYKETGSLNPSETKKLFDLRRRNWKEPVGVGEGVLATRKGVATDGLIEVGMSAKGVMLVEIAKSLRICF